VTVDQRAVAVGAVAPARSCSLRALCVVVHLIDDARARHSHVGARDRKNSWTFDFRHIYSVYPHHITIVTQ
jgi:hypothetical protein